MSKADFAERQRGHRLRSSARLAAVQALFQMEQGGRGVKAVVREWREHRFGAADEAPRYVEADEPFFETLLTGSVEHQADVDAEIGKRLTSGWRLDRIDSTLRAILRVGVYELLHGEAPDAVVIDEYVEVAKAFFEGSEPQFVNAVLDGAAKGQGGA